MSLIENVPVTGYDTACVSTLDSTHSLTFAYLWRRTRTSGQLIDYLKSVVTMTLLFFFHLPRCHSIGDRRFAKKGKPLLVKIVKFLPEDRLRGLDDQCVTIVTTRFFSR